jgi:hypothetical protein
VSWSGSDETATASDAAMPLLKRLSERSRPSVPFFLDGQLASALAGDTVLTAVLTQAAHLRHTEFSGAPRAGFCMMGACQDCWISLEDGRRVRACSTFITAGMRLVSRAPATHGQDAYRDGTDGDGTDGN